MWEGKYVGNVEVFLHIRNTSTLPTYFLLSVLINLCMKVHTFY